MGLNPIRSPSAYFIPGTPPAAEQLQAARLNQLFQVQFDGVPIRLREFDRGRKGETSVLTRELQNLFVQHGKGRHQALALHLFGQ